MKAALKVGLLKTIFIVAYLLVVLIAVNAWATEGNRHDPGCGASPFTAHIISFEKMETCGDVAIEISGGENVRYELSPASIDFGCGTISDGWNSQGSRSKVRSCALNLFYCSKNPDGIPDKPGITFIAQAFGQISTDKCHGVQGKRI
ncbi:MAG: hypothetical protein MI975_20320 [Cytophagales bacterium]|nr:hypothetical protein [Cytophagales bacterium]